MFHESVHSFGDRNILCGVLTSPSNIAADNVCVVFLNAGIVHKVGPYRMNVDIARAIADLGVPAFRFDLSGLGDSLKRVSKKTDDERMILDIKETFDYIEGALGINRFIVFGLCSGADNAHAIALVDDRLVGAVMLDGPAYPNFIYNVINIAPKIISLKSWKNLAKRLLNSKDQKVRRQAVYVRSSVPREQIESEISLLVNRGVELLYMYSGGHKYFNHRSQFKENFPSIQVNNSGSQVQCEYFGNANHTYPDIRDRKLMTDRVLQWVKQKFIEPGQ